MKTQMDMLNGSLADKILRFSIPLALTGILQQVFNAADVMVVGRFASKNAMAAVGSNTPIIGLVVNLFVGISIGANVVIARFAGQKKFSEIKKTVHTAILISIVSGVVMALLGIIASKPVLLALAVPTEVLPMALAYLRIYMLGLPVILLYNFESAIFRSQGDTRTPLICLIIAGLLNVILNLVFVIVFKLNAAGVAIATVLSNLMSASVMFILLLRFDGVIKIELRLLKIDGFLLKEILRIGVPAGVQSMVFSFSNIIVQSAINSLGPDIMAASSAAFNVEIFSYFVLNAFGQACTTFIGQNFGARKLDRCRLVTKYALFMDLAFTIVMSVIIVIFSSSILGLFNEDPAVIAYGHTRILFITPFQILNALMEIFSGTMRGYGNSLAPAAIAAGGICVTRIIWVFTAFASNPTFNTLLTCYPLSWLITASILIGYYFHFRKKVIL